VVFPTCRRSHRNTPNCGREPDTLSQCFADSVSFEPIRTNQPREISHAPSASGQGTRVDILRPAIAKEWTDEEWRREEWRPRTARGLQPSIPCPRHTVCTRADPAVAAKHQHVTGRYINRVAAQAAAESNRQVSCPAGCWARRRIESSGKLSGRTPPN
jgi:hypothetical protein